MHAIVLAALLLVSAPSRLDVVLERGHILVGMTGDYRPFSYLREDGR